MLLPCPQSDGSRSSPLPHQPQELLTASSFTDLKPQDSSCPRKSLPAPPFIYLAVSERTLLEEVVLPANTHPVQTAGRKRAAREGVRASLHLKSLTAPASCRPAVQGVLARLDARCGYQAPAAVVSGGAASAFGTGSAATASLGMGRDGPRGGARGTERVKSSGKQEKTGTPREGKRAGTEPGL